mmetsp:Transcript_3144/g.4828  ORF Transcript_3144/g.4828 Transcript_3144/m.4828 type:complete len:545 (+) Transcript_3144:66-1700(+)
MADNSALEETPQPVTPTTAEGNRSIESRLVYIEKLLIRAQEEEETNNNNLARALAQIRKLRDDWQEQEQSSRTKIRNLSIARRRAERAARIVVGGLRRLPARREKSFNFVVDDEEWETESEAEKVPYTNSVFTKSKFGLIHPNSAFKRRWDFASSALAVAFVFGAEARATAERWGFPTFIIFLWKSLASWSTMACHIFFAVDMILNFVTGYVDASGALIMSKRRIAKNYLFTGAFFLDAWCLVGFSEAPTGNNHTQTCAPGSTDTPLSYCSPQRRRFLAPFRVIRAVSRRVPPILAFAKRTGRLRTVVVHSPGITAAIVHFRGLLRATRLIRIKWTSLLVFLRGVARFFAKQAQRQINNAYKPVRKRLAARRSSRAEKKAAAASSASSVTKSKDMHTTKNFFLGNKKNASTTVAKKSASANATVAVAPASSLRQWHSEYIQLPSLPHEISSSNSRIRTASLDGLLSRPDCQDDLTFRVYQRSQRPVLARRFRRSRSKPDLAQLNKIPIAPIDPLILQESDSLASEYSVADPMESYYCGDAAAAD